jgi:uridine kinase
LPAAAPVLIAITGGSGSGKSTLAGALAAALEPDRCVVVTEDNYYWPRSRHVPPTAGLSVAEIEAVVNFDDPAAKDMDLFRRHLEALKAGQPVDQPHYRFDLHDRDPSQTHRIEPRPVVIAEGVHVMWHAETARLFDLRIYVDTRDDLRVIRRIRRDLARGARPSG